MIDPEYMYQRCADCWAGKHHFARTDDEVTVIVRDKDGNQGVVTVPGETTYIRVGAMCYIPTLSHGDDIPEGHDKTLIELWEQHGLMPMEWSVPAG